jgi:hypothetical protein
MYVYFPGVVRSVDVPTNCHLSYKPLGKLAPLPLSITSNYAAPLPYSDECDPKLFGTMIWKNLIDNNSNITVAAAGCQSSKSLVELHWKIMVHMARAYLTEKPMPWSF